MRSVIVILIAAILCVATIACLMILRKSKLRISLRGLLVFIAILAVLMSAVIGYRRSAMARLVWLAPDSNAAAQLFPTAEVAKNDEGKFEFTYYARNRSIRRLPREAMNIQSQYGEESVYIAAADRSTADELLKGMRDADKLPAGSLVIRGRVRDNQGRPLANAHIDLRGPFVFINCFKTRDDGTFTMALSDRDPSVRDGSTYYLTVRSANETAKNRIRWHSEYISLRRSNPEMVVEIAVPEQ